MRIAAQGGSDSLIQAYATFSSLRYSSRKVDKPEGLELDYSSVLY